MDSQPVIEARRESQGREWRLGALVAFRFCFVYFSLFCLTNQIFGALLSVTTLSVPNPATLWPTRNIVIWTATYLFHVSGPLIYTGSGSGDKTFDWVLTSCSLALALLVTSIWSVLDRKRASYTGLNKWFRILIRFALASQMLLYGMVKVIPLQMPYPGLTRLIEPYGNFSPMGVLWASIGASPSYEIFSGSAEVFAGILLIVPRTATFGAMVCVAVLTEIFTLNMTYDIPVKLFSFQLLCMSIFLLAPEIPRIWRFFFTNAAVSASAEGQEWGSKRAYWVATIVQIVFGLWLLAVNAHSNWDRWGKFGGGRAKPPYYGIWNVDEMAIDRQVRTPLVNDYGRWRRVVFEVPTAVTFMRMDDSMARFDASMSDRKLTLKKPSDKAWSADFTITRVSPRTLSMDGEMDRHAVHLGLSLVERERMPLVSRGFHWIQEYPFNR